MNKTNLQKPRIKMLWRGQQGNKFRVWEIINHNGIRFVRANKEEAYKQYKASLSFYNKVKR